MFLAFGGFDPRLYPRPAIEDIELGYRLTRAGHRIVLARDVLATHMKRWTLREMVRTDIFRRGVPWMLLIKRTGTVETDLNVKVDAEGVRRADRVDPDLRRLSPPRPRGRPWPRSRERSAVASLAAIVAINREFFAFLARRKGWRFACAAVPLHLVYYCCCGLSVVIAMAHWQLGRFRSPRPARPRGRARAHLASSRPAGRRVSRRDAEDRGVTQRRPRGGVD